MLWKTFICFVLLLLAVGEAARPDENASDKKDPAPKKNDSTSSNYKAEKAEINDYNQAEKAAADAQKREEAWMKKYMVSPDRRARGHTAVPKA
jgi:hypothetical protein